MKLTFLPIRAFAPILFLTAFLGFASPASADHCGRVTHEIAAKWRLTDLHCAAYGNDAKKAEQLIRAGADVNAHDNDQATPLHSAARSNADKVAALLIRAGADLSARAEYERAPLHSAARSNADKVAALLIRAGADVNARSHNQKTPLHWTLSKDADGVAALLIRAGADINARAEYERAPLHSVGLHDAKKVTALLIRAGADLNARDKEGRAPLYTAANSYYDEEIVALLIRAGADLNARGTNGKPLLNDETWDSVARLIRNPQEAIALANKIDPPADASLNEAIALANKIDPPTGAPSNLLILHEAAFGNAEQEAAAANSENPPNENDLASRDSLPVGEPPQEGSEPVVSDPSPERGASAAVAFAELLRAQKSESPAAAPPETALPAAAPPQAAPPEAASQAANPAQAQIVVDGACDLCDAVKLGDAEIIALLLQAGHDPNARDASGKTVLSYAIQSQRVDIVRMLTKGVDAPPPPPETPPQPEAPPPPDPAVLRTAEEDAALERARSADSLEGWLAFAEGEFGDGKYAAIAKAELREITEESFRRHRTALHFAADHNDIQQAEMLLHAGANPNAQTDRGFTPLMFAAKKSNLEIVKMLLDYGANPKLRERNRKNALDYVRGENGYAIREMIKKWRPSQ